ncbi:MAG TPA: PaaX family transcriptional regulator C-terminal domain-containing protein [Acidimicrobiales bacterium]|nr:PaaX family transcriptional regulator C-terminal domain-containing protein [Acidimicrobiales bacterium]
MSPDRKSLTARSVLASTLLGLDPPVLSARRLVESAELFGISEGTARTALSRMTAAGELTADDGRYRLAGRLLDRQRRQDEGRRPRTRSWKQGRWRLAVVTADGARTATERADLRSALTRLRLAEWREGVWARPDNLDVGVDHDHCTTLIGTVDADDRDLARALWDLDGWAKEARDLRDELRRTPPDSLADGFVLAAAVVRHLAADPLLPPSLLPARWPGDGLRTTYDTWLAEYRRVLADWHRSR